MNQAITETTNPTYTIISTSNRISLLSRIVGYLTNVSIPRHQNFIEENLLDKNLGPEIHRSLR